MKQHPILFSTPMVQAIMAGNKTQTRRTITQRRSGPCGSALKKHLDWSVMYPNNPYGIKVPILEVLGYQKHETLHRVYPPYDPGEQLWVRETWVRHDRSKFLQYLTYQSGDLWYKYRADGKENFDTGEKIIWKPSIFMPREVSRITLEVTEVRVERLPDISEEDAKAEGITLPNYAEQAIKDVHYPEPSQIFRELWEKINGPGSWEINPWVWVITFKRIEL